MLPRLRMFIHIDDVRDFEHLESLASECERVFDSAESFRGPPPPDKSMDATQAYHPPRSFRSRTQVAAVTVELPQSDPEEEPTPNLFTLKAKSIETPPLAKKKIPPKSISTPKTVREATAVTESKDTEKASVPVPTKLTWWNCGSDEYMLRDCHEPRLEKFCYRCGKKGFTKFDCPHCSENSQRNQ